MAAADDVVEIKKLTVWQWQWRICRGSAFYTFLQEQQSMHGWVMGNLSLAYNAQSRLQDRDGE